jgi:endoglucanase Acf2
MGTYVLYSLNASLELTLSSNSLSFTSGAGFSGTIRISKLIDPSQEAILDASHTTIPTALNFTYTVQGDVSTQTWKWKTVGGSPADLLTMSWPHHR